MDDNEIAYLGIPTKFMEVMLNSNRMILGPVVVGRRKRSPWFRDYFSGSSQW